MSEINFPSEFVDPYKKNTAEYCMKYAKAFERSAQMGYESKLFSSKVADYDKWRKFAEGKQDPDMYMKQVGVKGGKNGKSWKSLDTSILPIAPKFVELLIGKIISKGYDAQGFRKTVVKGIDRKSAEEERDFKAKLSEQVINKDFISEMKQKGVDMPMNTDGVPVPESLKEVDTYADIFRKDEYAIEAKDALLMWFESNQMEQQAYEYIEDLIKVSDGGMWTDLDQNGNIKLRRAIPERLRTNNCRFKDFRDLSRVGEYIDVTISELRQMWPGQPESVYKSIANNATDGMYGGAEPSVTDMGYPYDKERITIFHCRWLSTDTWKHVITKDKSGKKKVEKKPFNFPTSVKDGQAIKLDDYYKKHPNKEIVPTELQNVYQCKWIVGTKYCFDEGLMNNIQRTKNSLYGANLGVHLYHLTSNIIEKIIPIINMIQVAWLQHQNHVARSKPSAVSIEMSALEGLAAGKNKDKLTIKEAIRLYFDTGIVFWRRKNFSNASNQFRPIEELNNNMSQDANQFMEFIKMYIDLLRDILGINEVEDASTPNPEILKGVAEMAALGTKHALKDLYHGTKSIYERTAKSVIDLTPDARHISKHKGFENALGARSDQFWKELGIREMGIIIEEGPDRRRQETFESAVNKSVENQLITPDEGAEFLNDDNLIRAAQALRDKIKMRQREQEESQMRISKQQADDNIRSAQEAAKAEAEKIDKQKEANKEEKTHETDELIRLAREEHKLKMEQLAFEKNFEKDLQDDQQDHELDKQQVDIEGKKEIEKAKPKPTMAPMNK